jgi:DNA-binding transcriptional ArsR family regulator
MADLLPSSPDVEGPDGDPRVIGVDSDDAESLLSALSSETARRILSTLHDDPAPPSEVAEEVDTSLQNVQYHLGRLEEAGVVEVAGTMYSEKGREMNVYAPADSALVVVAGPESESDGLRSALSRLLGGVGVLGVASVVLDRVVRQGVGVPFGTAGPPGGEPPGGEAGAPAGGATPTPDGGDAGLGGNVTVDAETATATPTETATAGDAGIMSEPGTATVTPTGTPTPTPSPTDLTGATTTPTTTPTPDPTTTPTPTPTPAPTPDPTPTVTTTPMPSPEAAETAARVTAAAPATPVETLAASPGVLFFLGGATVLVGLLVWGRLGS